MPHEHIAKILLQKLGKMTGTKTERLLETHVVETSKRTPW